MISFILLGMEPRSTHRALPSGAPSHQIHLLASLSLLGAAMLLQMLARWPNNPSFHFVGLLFSSFSSLVKTFAFDPALSLVAFFVVVFFCLLVTPERPKIIRGYVPGGGLLGLCVLCTWCRGMYKSCCSGRWCCWCVVITVVCFLVLMPCFQGLLLLLVVVLLLVG